MNSAIGLNLPVAPSVDTSQAVAVAPVAAHSVTAASVVIQPPSSSHSCIDGECLKQGDGGFLEVLNAELEALVGVDAADFLALATVGDLDNNDKIEELTELDITHVVLADLQQAKENPSEVLGLVAPVVAEVVNELFQELELEFKQALLELPKNVTALPLTPENKAFIQQQALALVEQKHPELIAKLQQDKGQNLPLEGKLLPLVEDALAPQDNSKLIQLASMGASAMAQNWSEKELTSEVSKNESGLESELSLKNALAQTDAESDGLKEQKFLENIQNKNATQADAPTQKFSVEAVTTSVNNILGINHASIINPTAAAVQSGSTLQLPQNPSPEQWGSALGDKVQWMMSTKLNSAEIRIDPPHLGKMDISIKMTDDGASIVIQTQHAATRELVDAASYRLKEMLEEAGYKNVDVDVSHKEDNQADSQLADNEKSNELDLAVEDEDAQGASAEDVLAGTLNNGRAGLDLYV